jgi:hypothetical protein
MVGSGEIVNFRDSSMRSKGSFEACSGRVSGKTSPQWPSQRRSHCRISESVLSNIEEIGTVVMTHVVAVG